MTGLSLVFIAKVKLTFEQILVKPNSVRAFFDSQQITLFVFVNSNVPIKPVFTLGLMESV